MSLYGKLTKNMSLSMFTIKRGGGNKAEADDSDDYLVALGMKLSPALTLTPWVANSRTAKATATTTGMAP